jgi:hypothetical protein
MLLLLLLLNAPVCICIAVTFLSDHRVYVADLGQNLRRNALKVGFLMKCGEHKKTWHRRWFILSSDSFGYFESDVSTAPLGTALLRGTAATAQLLASWAWMCTAHLLKHPLESSYSFNDQVLSFSLKFWTWWRTSSR